MSTNTTKAANIEAAPFFARFLEEQVAEVSDTAPYETKKWPSDWEEY
ncbi:MAG: microviridin/marinostatin family tricyclic proteinase inhibitor [Nostoc sp. TH1S01]|uniref:MdnA n=1 Tax=uncultured Nostoc sp. TaxID=340711 RepID=A0A8F8FFG2_9NOSO|nr:microviridin/marinostatin family tricyclic proteinase inhibitor [Nostoc sp. TH1S01]QXY08312.1 MdnA [uncultured Nostoc sp.]